MSNRVSQRHFQARIDMSREYHARLLRDAAFHKASRREVEEKLEPVDLSDPESEGAKILATLRSTGGVPLEALHRILTGKKIYIEPDELRLVLRRLEAQKEVECHMRGPSCHRVLHWSYRRGY